jgi:hypothetical protein
VHRPYLIGMGDSDKLADSGPGSYRFVEHRHYLDGLLEALDARGKVTLAAGTAGAGGATGTAGANRWRLPKPLAVHTRGIRADISPARPLGHSNAALVARDAGWDSDLR